MKHVSTPWLPRSRDSAAGSELQRAVSRNVDRRVLVCPPDPRSSGCWLFLLLSMSKVKAASNIWRVSLEGLLGTCWSPSNMPRIGLGGDCCCAHFTANNAGCSRLHQITHSSLFWQRSLSSRSPKPQTVGLLAPRYRDRSKKWHKATDLQTLIYCQDLQTQRACTISTKKMTKAP